MATGKSAEERLFRPFAATDEAEPGRRYPPGRRYVLPATKDRACWRPYVLPRRREGEER